MNIKKPALISTLFCCLTANAQMPGNDIYVADLTSNQGTLVLGDMVKVTDRAGYDNQPLFLPDNDTLLYTSGIGVGESEQTDSFSYKLSTGERKNLTNSSVSEYSPTMMPNGSDFSVIRAANGEQKLWRYPLDKGQPSELLKDVNPVGYHAWIDEEQLILFVLGEPHELQLANVKTQSSQVIDKNIGASLYKIPGTELMSYSAIGPQSTMENPVWELKTYDPTNQKINVLTTLPESAYYYGWSGDGKAIAAKGTELLQWDSKNPDSKWTKFADVSKDCPKGVTRLTTNANNTKLAYVCSK